MFRTALFSPTWWESLDVRTQSAIGAYFVNGADLFNPINPQYLTNGVEGICRWEFDQVVCEMGPLNNNLE